MADENKSSLLIVSIVAIVAIVGIVFGVVGIKSYSKTSSFSPFGSNNQPAGSGFSGRDASVRDANLAGKAYGGAGEASQISLHVLSPNGGEIFQVGTNITILWESNGIAPYETVKLAINTVTSNNQQSGWGVFATTNNSGNYSVLIPPGSEGRHLIGVVYEPTFTYDTSDAPFSIVSNLSNYTKY